MFRRMSPLIARTLGLIALATFVGPAAAGGALDQGQISSSAGVEALGLSVERLAQTFTAGRTGMLDQVDLLLDRNLSPGDLIVEIRAAPGGVPTSTVLATATVAESNVVLDGPAWVSVPLTNPAVSTAGTQYAVVLSAPGVDCGAVCYQWGTALDDHYPRGAALDSLDDGASWFSPGAGLDRAFKTYVTPERPAPVAVERLYGSVTYNGVANYKLGVNVTRVNTNLFGSVRFGVSDSPLIHRATLDAKPMRLEIAGDSACVVARVTRFSGDWPYTPVLIAVTIRDVAGGPDLFTAAIDLSENNPYDLCTTPPSLPVSTGDFTVRRVM